MDAPAAAEEIIRNVRADHPHLTIVARARDALHATLLYKLGVTDAVPETIEASLQLSEAVLIGIGIPAGLVIASVHEKRDEFRKMLQPIGTEPAQPRRAIKMSTRMQDKRK
jgi:CPA2 family monovalent cation:H+ antiporter-2